MSADTEDHAGRATISDVYKIVGDLRREMNDALCGLRDDQRTNFDALMLRLDQAIASIRDDFVTVDVLDAAVKASEGDRERLWGKMREVEAAAKDDVKSAHVAASLAAALAQKALERVLLIAGGLAIIPTVMAAVSLWLAMATR